MNTGSVSKTTASSSASSKGRRKSPPPRPDPDRIKSTKGATTASGGTSTAVRSLHSHGTGGAGAARRIISGRLEETGGNSDSGGGGGTATGCSGTRHAGPGPNRRRIPTESMRGDRLNADQIKFNNVKFDSVKFGHQVTCPGGNKSVVIWDPSPSSPTRRGSTLSGSMFGSSNRFQSVSTKSTASYVIAASPERQIGHASVKSGTGRHASMTSYKARPTQPHLHTSASSVAERPSQSSIIVVLSKDHPRRREESAVVSISDSMVRTSPGVFRMLNAPSKIRSVSSKVWARQLAATAKSEAVSTVDVHGPEIYGKVCRKKPAAGTRDPLTQDDGGGGGGFRQICSSASYTVVLDRMQRERASEHSAASRATAAADHHRQPLQPSEASKCKPGTADTENVKKSAPCSDKSREVRTEAGGIQKKCSCVVVDVAAKPEKATSERELAIEAASASSSSGVDEDGAPKPLEEDNDIVCELCSSSVACGGPPERTEFQKDQVLLDVMSSETTANEGGGTTTTKNVRFTRPSCVSETQAVDHFRVKLSEERATTATLRRRLGAVRKDLTKCRTDMRREEELRKRTEQWSEYLEQELGAYVRSRAEAEKRYLNLLQVVRGIDRFTKQLLHKYVALHRKIEPGRQQRLAADNPFQIHRASRSHVSTAGPSTAPSPAEKNDSSLRSDAVTAVRAEPAAAEAGDKCPPLPSTEDDHSLDHLSNDDYDFITKYLKASASLPDANAAAADVDSVGLYPEADECDTEANWSSNNFISFREASRSLDEIEAAEGQHQDKSIVQVLESEDPAAAGALAVAGEVDCDEDAVCAGDNQGTTKNFDIRLRRLGKFFDQVVRICRRKPEAYFRLLADKSCLLADEIRLSVEERKRRNVRSERRRRWQNGDIITKDYIFQVRSHGAGDLAEGTHVDMENANGYHEHVSPDFEDEVYWEDEEEEEEAEEEVEEEEEKLWQQEEEKRKKIEEEEKKQLEEKREKKREEKRIEEKKLEEQRREEKKREEKKIEEKKLEEQKREEKKREEKRIKEKKLEEQKREEKKREEKRIEEKKLEEQKREEKKIEEKKLEEQKREEKKIEEKKLEEQKREEKKRLEKRIEELKLEEQKREENKREEKRIEEKKLEEQKREEKKRLEKRIEELKLEEQKREEKKREEKRIEEKKLEEQKLEEKRRDEKKLEEQKREEKKREERKREEKKREEKKREEKKREDDKQDDDRKLKSTSSESSDQGVDAAPLPPTPKAEGEKKASKPSSHKEEHRGSEERAAGLDGVGDDRLAPPTGVQREYIKRLLKEMCHYCDRYRPGDRAAGLKAFLRDTIEAEFL